MTCGVRWRRIELPAAMRPRMDPSVTPTPRGVVVFGGMGEEGARGDGWLWDGRAWSALPRPGGPSPRTGHVAVWTGNELVVWGGESDGAPLDDGAAYDPVLGRWRVSEGAPVELPGHSGAGPGALRAGVTTPSGVVVWGGTGGTGVRGDGRCTDPQSGQWEPVLAHGAPPARADATMLWDGHAVLVLWGRDDDGLLDDAWALDL